MRRLVLRLKRIKFRWRWRRSRQMDDQAGLDMKRGFPTFTSQCTTQYPRQQSQQEIDGSNKKSEGVFVDEVIKVFQSRRFHFQCFNLPRLHDVLLMRLRLLPLVRGSGFR